MRATLRTTCAGVTILTLTDARVLETSDGARILPRELHIDYAYRNAFWEMVAVQVKADDTRGRKITYLNPSTFRKLIGSDGGRIQKWITDLIEAHRPSTLDI
jgi:hypothetical protein